ncbi:MAG: hypothetical protein ACT4TC_23375 [Myxococcaceae bacterium]
MKERVFRFGPEGCLVGVLTDPDAGSERASAPTLVLTNIGMNHRVGPNRLNVETARALAADGYRVFRFDLSGRGDSEVRRDAQSDNERSVLDMKDALDFLQKTRMVDRFALAGLCSGVDAVHPTSVRDPRVVGVIWLDGYGYRTTGYWVRWYSVRLLDRHQWRRKLKDFLRQRILRRTREVQERMSVFSREYPTPEQLRKDLDTLVGRNVRQLYIYTGGARTEYFYRDQFFDMLHAPHLRGEVEVELWPRADHLFSTLAQRKELIDKLRIWMGGF